MRLQNEWRKPFRSQRCRFNFSNWSFAMRSLGPALWSHSNLFFVFRKHNHRRMDAKGFCELYGPFFPNFNFIVFQQTDIRNLDAGMFRQFFCVQPFNARSIRMASPVVKTAGLSAAINLVFRAASSILLILIWQAVRGNLKYLQADYVKFICLGQRKSIRKRIAYSLSS